MNFARDVVDAAPPERSALVELTRDGSRHSWSFGAVAERSARLAGTLERHGVGRGDVVMTLIGNRSEWVLAMVAGFRIGAVVFPCNEQLRAYDLELRLRITRPALVICDERNRTELELVDPACTVLLIPDESLFASQRAAAVELEPSDPCLIVFTSGTSGQPKGVLHAQRYLTGQMLQAKHWLGTTPGQIVWCTATSGWSKSARNVFIAPWLRGATALIHDARFDAAERIHILAREHVDVLCMTPTEYRRVTREADLPRFPDLAEMVSAGEPLDPQTLDAWKAATRVEVRDGYGQTETGQLTANPVGMRARSGSMGKPLPGVRAWTEDGEFVVDPATVPTFFLGYLDGSPSTDPVWRTGDRVTCDDDGYFFFEGRTDDVIISSGYRIGPFEVESVLLTHPAIDDAAVVGEPDAERGAVVRAVVVLTDNIAPSVSLTRDIQAHVKRTTAPYKYPRIVDYVAHLPRTASGKLMRAELRSGSGLR